VVRAIPNARCSFAASPFDLFSALLVMAFRRASCVGAGFVICMLHGF